MNVVNYLLNKLFNGIWNIQIRIMHCNLSFNSFFDKYNKRFRIIGFIFLIFFLVVLMILYLLQIYNILFDIFKVLTFSSFLAIIILYIIKIILSSFTSLRFFFGVSILLNLAISHILANLLYSHSGYEKLISIILFTFLYCAISLLANTKVSKVANTIIEISLGLLSLIKVFISYGFDTYIFPQLTSTIDEVLQAKEILSFMENELIKQIEVALLPLLIINGCALLICEVHSYWIDKYNEGKEIT